MSLVLPDIFSKVAKEESAHLDDQVLSFLHEDLNIPHKAVTSVVDYMSQHFEGAIFGPWHWKTFWDATPVTLPSIEMLRKRVADSGKQLPKSVDQMSAEECANFVGEQGTEDKPEIPEALQKCLSAPVRTGQQPAGMTCAVTYIPQYVRKEGKVLAVTARTFAVELAPNPKQGSPAEIYDVKSHLQLLTKEDADGTEVPCYFVMELAPDPTTKGMRVSPATDQILNQGDKGWRLPDARNFMAAVFSRVVWRGEILCQDIYTHMNSRAYNLNQFLAFGGHRGYRYPEVTCRIASFREDNPRYAAVGSRKFQPKGQ